MQAIASTEQNKSRQGISRNTCPVKLHKARFRVKVAKKSILDEEEKILAKQTGIPTLYRDAL